MGNSFDQYRSASGGSSAPVGSIIQAPYNLTDPAYMPCDYRKLARAPYPKLSACLPSIGVFTITARTKSAVPQASAIASDATNWVVTGAAGTTNLYTTPDGITYTARTTPASCDIRSILNDGTNFVAANSIAGSMLYSTNSGVTWGTSATATVAASGGGSQTCMTWASTLGTVGRFCLANGTATVWTSDDRGVTWTSRATGLGQNVTNVCWTGQKYIGIIDLVSTIATSADGITWSKQTMPIVASASIISIISDGNGKVLLTAPGNNSIATSMDHGTTWAIRQFATPLGGFIALSSVANYTNGRFIVQTSQPAGIYTVISTDLVGWVVTADMNVNINGGQDSTFSYKSGVYLNNPYAGNTSAFTLTEDMTYMRLPYTVQTMPFNKTDFIKMQ